MSPVQTVNHVPGSSQPVRGVVKGLGAEFKLVRKAIQNLAMLDPASLASRPAAPSPAEPSPPPRAVPEKVLGELTCYSHWGEDLVVLYLLNKKRNGFYVDVGCYHPTLISITKLLFDAGWTGVNIDPNPFMIEQFKIARPKDVNLNLALSDVGGTEIDFFMFNDWGSSNTVSSEFAEVISTGQGIKVEKSVRVACETLGSIFEKYCAGRVIDFLNIDVESVDVRVLQSSDWKKWRPSIVAIEDFEFDYGEPTRSSIYRFLTAQDYKMISRNVYTSFLASAESGIRL